MSIKTSIESLAEPIGFDIANSDDIVQANLLNGLGRGFKTHRERKLEMQMSYVSQKLNKETENWIKILYEFIELKNKRL